jgi:spermidine/putrescine transport system permease protein
MEQNGRIAILLTPTVLFLTGLFLIPLLFMALFSFREGSFGAAQNTFTLRHYAEFFANDAYLRLLWRSVALSFLVSVLTVLFAYPVAYYLSFFAGDKKYVLLTIIIVPAWVSYLLRVLSWKVILGGSGALASFLSWLGLAQEGGSLLLFSPEAVVVTLLYVWVPFVALPIFAGLERIDPDLLEAAYDLGCNRLKTFWRITLPLSLPGVLAGFLFVFIPTVGEYVTPALVGGPDGIMFGNIVRDQFLRALNWPLGAMMSLAMLVVVLVPLYILSRFVRLSELAGL